MCTVVGQAGCNRNCAKVAPSVEQKYLTSIVNVLLLTIMTLEGSKTEVTFALQEGGLLLECSCCWVPDIHNCTGSCTTCCLLCSLGTDIW